MNTDTLQVRPRSSPLLVFVLLFVLIFQPLTPAFAQEAPLAENTSSAIQAPPDATVGTQPESTEVHTPALQAPADELSQQNGNIPDRFLEQMRAIMGDRFTEDLIRPMPLPPGIDPPTPPVESNVSGSDSPLQTYLYDKGNAAPHTSMGSLSGSFGYTVPIVIPPGRNGIQPDLAFVYDSQSGQNLNSIGYGWDIPIPYIERVNKLGVQTLYTDGYFTSSMSGELATTTNAALFTVRSDDGSYLKYSFASSTNRWTVTDKNGVTYKFGYNASARVAHPTDTTKVYRWMLEEVRDANGNFVSYTYFKDGGFLYPQKITYTGSGSTPGIFTIDFLRELRPDTATSTQAGFEQVSRYRIKQVSVSVNGTWARKYDLAYTSGDGGLRSLLASISESGQSSDTGSQVVISKPAMNFEYSKSRPSWERSTTFQLPESLRNTSSPYDTGARFLDYNGDGLVDIVRAVTDRGFAMYANDGAKWNVDYSWTFPTSFVSVQGVDRGVRTLDANGDGLVDIVQYGGDSDGHPHTYLNTGTEFVHTESARWTAPLTNASSDGQDSGVRYAEINGDGRIDVLHSVWYPQYAYGSAGVAINARDDYWNFGSWQGDDIPVSFMNLWSVGGYSHVTLAVELIDVNGDGLDDIVASPDGQIGDTGVFIGTGTGWTLSDLWTIPVDMRSGDEHGKRFVDINGDGLVDLVDASRDDGDVYINTGSSWKLDPAWTIPFIILDPTGYTEQILDINGDTLPDFVRTKGDEQDVYINKNPRTDLLVHVKESAGATVSVQYESSASATRNPDLPFALTVATAIGQGDGLGTIATTSYAYENGSFYFATPTDRQFAGFGKITETNPMGATQTAWYHQGNWTDSAMGESTDHRSKIGRAYRTEVRDVNGNLYALSIQGWDRMQRGTATHADFVYLATSTMLSYDGDGDHRDIAETFSYNSSTGDVVQKRSWGEVLASTDGTFTDIGTDRRTTTYAYTSATSPYLVVPQRETISNQSNIVIQETKNYYDGLALGSISKGNLTKQERLVSGTSTIDIEKSYNAYGLVTEEKDPRDKITRYAYDNSNLYPSEITNALTHKASFVYDLSSGKVKRKTDQNGFVYETRYDGFDRPVEEKQPDLPSSSTLVTARTYSYNDTAGQKSMLETRFLDNSNTARTYHYFDGLDRLIQERKETETSAFSAKDIVYDAVGLVAKESLQYLSSGAGKTSPTATAVYYTSHTYDPLKRLVWSADALGTTTVAYDDWSATTTDALGNPKGIVKDAYGNIVQVNEVNGTSIYATRYTWDQNGNLTKITDALGNIRTFTYDNLGRRLSAEDLHAPTDTTFGTRTYSYDPAGNITKTRTPRGHTVNATYDDLNRITSEDFTSGTGMEQTYLYDSCTGGIGKLCRATMIPSATTTYAYNALGLASSMTRAIANSSFTTATAYDRQGNTTLLTHPDNSQTKYTYNTAGLLETVQGKSSTGAFKPIVSDINYAPHFQITSLVYGNNASTTNTYGGAQLYRLVNKRTAASDHFKLQDLAYAYDKASNITRIIDASRTATGKTVNYTYDKLYRLATASTTGSVIAPNYRITYQYNPIGNITSASNVGTYTYGTILHANPHAPTKIVNGASVTTIGYDQSGNATSSGPSNYTWDYRERLATASTGGNPTSSYRYDHNDDRVYSFDGTASTYYGDRHHVARSGSATTTINVFVGDTLVAMMDNKGPASIITYAYTDHLGGTMVTTSEFDTNSIAGTTANTGFKSPTSTGSPSNQWMSPTYAYASDNRYTSVVGVSTVAQDYAGFNLSIPSGKVITGIEITVEGRTVVSTIPVSISLSHNAGTTYTPVQNKTLSTTEQVLTYGGPMDKWGREWNINELANANLRVKISVDSPTQLPQIDHLQLKVYYTTPSIGGGPYATTTQGHIMRVTDYLPYGDARSDQNLATTRKYIGQYHDNQSDLEYLNARYYEGSRGQFLSQDPTFLTIGSPAQLENLTGLTQTHILADPQQLNSYSYGRGNPIRFKDPKGLYIESGFDVAMLSLSIYQFSQDPSWTNAGAIALDAGALALPVPAVGGLALRAGRAVDNATEAEKTYQIYAKTKQGADGAEVYVGRTSGVRSADQNVAVRDANHHRSGQGFGPAQTLITTNSYNAVRGLEQIAQNYTKSLGQLTQQIRGVSASNPNLNSYLQAAQKQVGEIQKAINKLLGK